MHLRCLWHSHIQIIYLICQFSLQSLFIYFISYFNNYYCVAYWKWRIIQKKSVLTWFEPLKNVIKTVYRLSRLYAQKFPKVQKPFIRKFVTEEEHCFTVIGAVIGNLNISQRRRSKLTNISQSSIFNY